MPLSAGARLGSYEVISPLGAGGMGEVYRVHDSALKRDVAIKIVSSAFGGDEERRERFEREARLLASLNHPRIASVYGLVDAHPTGAAPAVRGIVMELVEGPTLADRLTASAMSVPEALSVAREIAEGLEAAHDKGIVHRDLKPANIKLSPTGVKILDFGIAKALLPEHADATTIKATGEGVVLGTAAYMSPEQTRGEFVDARTDIWAFGCVLYEMLTGRRAFAGRTAADTVTHVLKSDPEWSALMAAAPRSVARVIRRCLEKDPARRWRSIAAIRLAIEDLAETDETTMPAPRGWTPARVAAVVAGVLVVTAVAYFAGARSRGAGGPVAGTSIVAGIAEPPGETLYQFVDPLKISPDGKRVAMVTSSRGKPRLWLRSLDRVTFDPVPEGDGAMFPFWSPDGRSLGFCADGLLKILELASRSVRTLASVSGPLCGATWNRDDQLVMVGSDGLSLIPAAGGTPKPITTLDRHKGDLFDAFPQFLPDGRHFLFLMIRAQEPRYRVAIGSIDDSAATVLPGLSSMPIYAEPGYLIFARGSELVAQAFDPSRRMLSGDPAVIGGGLLIWAAVGTRALTISDTGTLVFMTRRIVATQPTWYERSGRPVGTIGDPAEWVHVALSPDGRTVAAERLDSRNNVGDVLTIDVGRNVTSSFSSGDRWSFAPIWSPDGTRLAFASERAGAPAIFARSVEGGESEPISGKEEMGVPTDWTKDRLIANGPIGEGGVWSIDLAADRRATRLLETAIAGTLSPDGRCLAYASPESGRPEVFVRAVAGGRAVQISRAGGSEPRWRRDGKELFFVSADRKVVAVPVTTGATFTAGEPQILPIDTQPDAMGARHTYDVDSLGQRFLVLRPAGVDPAPPIAVILDWRRMLPR